MRARIDGEGCCFCRQRLVTLNRLFMPDELKKKIYKIFYLNASFTFFCIVLTRSVLNNDFDDFCLRRLIFFLNSWKIYKYRDFA